ncbi:MAG TPA: aspartyl protease family protein [Pyrinomonadaceae bacterium]|nr:aspartyl protease family protein [Pyrinomonadaceae bacterium]
MNYRRLITLAFVLACSAASSPRPVVPALQKVTHPVPVMIPFELVNRHILIKVRVNNSAPLSFILDTGDKFAIVNLARAKVLGLNLQGEINVGGAGAGTLKGSFVRDASLTVLGLEGQTEPVVLTIPLDNLEPKLGHNADGIIGSDFIKKFVVEIDYPSRVLMLFDKDTFAYSGSGESIPMRLNSSGHAIIPAEVAVQGHAAIKGNFIVDIGSGGSLVLHSPIVETEHLPLPTQKTIRSLGGAGAGGIVTGRVGRVDALTIGKFRVDNPVTLFSTDKAGAFASAELKGNIGQRILSKFTIFLDYAHSRIILAPNASFKNLIGQAVSGLGLVGEGADYKTFRVDELLEDSPAAESGLQKGDIILAVDGRRAAELTLTELNEMFEQPVAHGLSVRRGEQTLQVTLTPRKLI